MIGDDYFAGALPRRTCYGAGPLPHQVLDRKRRHDAKISTETRCVLVTGPSATRPRVSTPLPREPQVLQTRLLQVWNRMAMCSGSDMNARRAGLGGLRFGHRLWQPAELSGTEWNSVGLDRAEALERVAVRRQHSSFERPVRTSTTGSRPRSRTSSRSTRPRSASCSRPRRPPTWSRSSRRCDRAAASAAGSAPVARAELASDHLGPAGCRSSQLAM